MSVTRSTQQDIYNQFLYGDRISNGDLLGAIEYWNEVYTLLRQAGPVFKLSCNEAHRVYDQLYDVAVARGLKKIEDKYRSAQHG